MSRKGKRKRSIIKQEKALKAIVFADSFTKEFRPITLEKPRVLLPLVNVPVLDYVLEMLICSGVHEIFIFCKENHDMISDYISKSKWSIEDKLFILTKHVKEAKNIGDFLRNVENYGVRINSDFIVLRGDVVSNINLKPILELHQKMRKRDGLLLMTSLFVQESSFANRRRYVENDKHSVSVAFGKKIGGVVPQIFQYKNEYKEVMEIDVSKTNTYEDIEIRSDLIDAHIDICCPDVIEVFKENFDYKDMRNDLLKGVLTDQVISVGNTVMPYIVPSRKGYCRRVSSLRAYESVSRDIVKRWMYPIVPESNFTGQSTFQLLKGNNYFETGIILDKGGRVGRDCVIGSRTRIGDESEIEKSIIGRNVTIGRNVKIRNSFIFDNAVIEDGCQITHSILMECTLRENAIIQRGCIITNEVIIGIGASIGPFASITVRRDDLGLEHESADTLRQDSPQTNSKDVGEGGKGRLYSGSQTRKPYNVLGSNINEIWPLRKRWVTNITNSETAPSDKGRNDSDVMSSVASPLKVGPGHLPFEEAEGEESEGEYMYFYDSDDYDDEFGGDDDEGDDGAVFMNKEDREKVAFFTDVREIVHRSVEKEHGYEKVYFELRSRQFAYDRSMCESAIAIIQGLIFYCSEKYEEFQLEEEEEVEGEEDDDEEEEKIEEKKEEEVNEDGSPKLQKKWLKFLEKTIKDDNSGIGVKWRSFLMKYVTKEKNFEKELLDSLLDLVESSEGGKFTSYLENIILILYEVEILTDSVILDWSEDVLERSEKYSSKDKELLVKCKDLLEWLKQTNEDEEEGEEEEDNIDFGLSKEKTGKDDDDGEEDSSGLEDENDDKQPDEDDEDEESSGLEDEDENDEEDVIDSDESELEDEDDDDEGTIDSEEDSD